MAQSEFDTAEAEAQTGELDDAATRGVVPPSISPAKAVARAEYAEMRKSLISEMAKLVNRFAMNIDDAVAGTELESDPSADDVFRAASILLYDRFHGALWETDTRRGAKNAAVEELLESEAFKDNVDALAEEMVTDIRSRFPELAPRFSLTASDSQKLRAEDMRKQALWLNAQAKAEGFEGIEDLLERDTNRFQELATQWRAENPREGWKLGARAKGMTTGAVTDAIKEAIAKMPRVMARTTVVADEKALPVHLQDGIADRNADGRVKGIFDPVSGRIYIVASNIENAQEAVATLLHEGVGEYGVDSVLGVENWSKLREALLRSEAAHEIAQTYFGKPLASLNADEQDEAAREVLSHMAENDTAEPALARRVWDFIRSVLRRLGVNLAYTDADAAYIVRKARGHVSYFGADDAAPLRNTLRFSLGEADESFLNFLRNGVADTNRVREEYHTAEGGKSLLETIAAKTRQSHPLKSQLAAILAKRLGNTTITVELDAGLSLDGVNGVARIASKTIALDPTLPDAQFHSAAIEEVMHIMFYDKLEAFQRGEFDRLTPQDIETLEGLEDIYQRVLAEAPASVRAIATAAISPNEKFARFEKLAEQSPEVEPWYHALNTHEFIAGTFTTPGFQLLLANIDSQGTRNAGKPGSKSILRRLFDLFTRLMLGHNVSTDSALYKSTTHVFELLDNNGAVKPGKLMDTGRDAELGSFKSMLSGALNAETRKEWRTSFVRVMQDRFIDLKNAQRMIAAKRGLTNLPDTQDAYMASELYHGRVGERLERFVDTHVEALRARMKKHGLLQKEVDAYLYARHAEERNKYIASIRADLPDGGSGMSTRAANRILRSFRDKGKLTALADVAAVVDQMNRESLQLMRNSGLIDPQLVTTLGNRYKNYVSLQGFKNAEDGEWTDDAAGVLPSLGMGFDIRGVEPRKAAGRKTKAGDVLKNTVEQAARVIIRAEKNRVSRAMANLIDANPDPTLWERAEPDYKIIPPAKPGQQAKRVVDPNWMRRDDVFAYKENGVVQFFRIHKESLARNWKNAGLAFGEGLWGAIGAGLSAFNRYKALVSTQLNPEFVVTNFFRDFQAAALNLSGDQLASVRAGVLADLGTGAPLAGAREAIRKHTYTSPYAQSFREMERHGGRIIFFGLDNAQRGIASAVKAVNEGNVRRAIGALGDFIGDYNGVVENASRLAVYHNLRKAGVSADRAAHHARNITVNFNRKGEAGPALNSLYLFFNANIQSTARIYEALKSRGWRRAAWLIFKLMGLGLTLSAMARYIGGKDPDDGRDRYDKVPDHVRHTNLVFMLPQGLREMVSGIPGVGAFLAQDGSYLKVPMPYGYNWFVNIGSAAEKYLSGNMTAAHTITDIFLSANEVWNPVGGAGTLIQQITPTAIRPITEMAINRDFSGKPIVPEDQPFTYDRPDHTKYFNSVSPMTKAVTDGINSFFGGNDARGAWDGVLSISPERVEYMMNYFFGSAGSFLGRAVSLYPDAKQKKNDGEAFPANNIPGFRRFFGAPTDQGTSQAYNLIRNESKRSYDEVELYVLAGDPNGARGAAQDHLAEIAIGKLVREVEAERTKIHQQMAALTDKPIDGARDEKISPALAALREADRKLQQKVILAYITAKRAVAGETDKGEAKSFIEHLGRYFDTKARIDLDKESNARKELLGF